MTISSHTVHAHLKPLWYPPASYKILSEFSPPVGQERFHCDMKRGFIRVRKHESEVATLLEQDSIPQRIGILAQKGVYLFHQNPNLLSQADGITQLAEILKLQQELPAVQEKVLIILQNYYQNPILSNKQVIYFNPGDEKGQFTPILIKQGYYKFNLYVAIDCIFSEKDGEIHILDFKTGTSKFDKRQAYIYLLATQYLYPNQNSVASFYNLETNQWSKPIRASNEALESMQIELRLIAERSQKEKKRYQQNPESFNEIFSPNPGIACRYCPVNLICQFSTHEVF